MNQEIDINTIESCALQITQKPTLDIYVTSWDSFRHGNRDYKLIEKDRWLTFEAHWQGAGLTNNDYTHQISIPIERWEEAKQIYSEWLKEQVNDPQPNPSRNLLPYVCCLGDHLPPLPDR